MWGYAQHLHFNTPSPLSSPGHLEVGDDFLMFLATKIFCAHVSLHFAGWDVHDRYLAAVIDFAEPVVGYVDVLGPLLEYRVCCQRRGALVVDVDGELPGCWQIETFEKVAEPASWVPSNRARYSASVMEVETVCCFLEHQDKTLPAKVVM